MASGTIQTRNASVYWALSRVSETRNVSIDMASDFAEDTVHGDTVRSFAPLFTNFNCSVTGLYNMGPAATGGTAAQLVSHALNAVSSTWSVFLNASTYFYGSGYVSIDNVGAPYDEFAPFDFSIRSIGTVSQYAL